MKIRKEIERHEVGKKLAWYWGKAWCNYARDTFVFYVIPLNLIFGFARDIWWKIAVRKSTKDAEYKKAYNQGFTRGYGGGYSDGRREILTLRPEELNREISIYQGHNQ